MKKTLVSSREEELNERLPAQKHVLLPDVLQEHVTRNVGFTSMRQTFRPTIEPLQPVRIYTVHDNVEIVEQNSPSYYSRVNDSIMYNILLKPTAHQGTQEPSSGKGRLELVVVPRDEKSQKERESSNFRNSGNEEILKLWRYLGVHSVHVDTYRAIFCFVDRNLRQQVEIDLRVFRYF